MSKPIATLAQLAEFDTLIDARSPAEFIDDQLPGAISCPVLDNEQRIAVGTLYKQASPFTARKLGAVLVARNVADHIEAKFSDQPKEWRPLVYCWRGGQRSGAFTHILREVGWDAARLEGGYRTWRRHVLEQLEQLPGHLHFRVITGPTGSAKSRVLEALARQGEQVLHLEQLAAHKGSVLGELPGIEQPAQRRFESALYAALHDFDPSRPVYVEAESRKIGVLHLPEQLIQRIRAGRCYRIGASLAERVNFLLRDYDYAIADPAWLSHHLGHLHGLHSNETLAHWNQLIHAHDFPALVEALLVKHYDPLYLRSQNTNFSELDSATVIDADSLSDAGIEALAGEIARQPAPIAVSPAPTCG
jgi:tRNA 2-selenouridine synthase